MVAAKQAVTHEDFRCQGRPRSSDRDFGAGWGILFAVVGLAPLLYGHSVRWWALGSSVVCMALAAAFPAMFGPANRYVSQFGAWLYRWTVNPAITGLVFYGVVTPAGVAARVLGKHGLQLRFNAEAESYWMRRPPGPERDSMARQF